MSWLIHFRFVDLLIVCIFSYSSMVNVGIIFIFTMADLYSYVHICLQHIRHSAKYLHLPKCQQLSNFFTTIQFSTTFARLLITHFCEITEK